MIWHIFVVSWLCNTDLRPSCTYLSLPRPQQSILPLVQDNGTAPHPLQLVSHFHKYICHKYSNNNLSQLTVFSQKSPVFVVFSLFYVIPCSAVLPSAFTDLSLVCPPLQGFNPTYPPQNPVYPPAGPAMMPPAQPPQWNGPPPGQYPPGPGAPMVQFVSVCGRNSWEECRTFDLWPLICFRQREDKKHW